MFSDALSEFRTDWVLSGRAASSSSCYVTLLSALAATAPCPTLDDARAWVAEPPTVSMRRKRAQAVRAFGRWSAQVGDDDFPWWDNVRVPTEREQPQPTALRADFEVALGRLHSPRDRALVAVLWGCGLRRGEAAQLVRSDINLGERYLVVRRSKTGKPRVVPMAPETHRLLRQHLRGWNHETVFHLTGNGITLMLRRNALLPAHAWRRGWAVEALRHGVSEASVRAAAGWASGAMVARYTRAVASELAIDEFKRAWPV